MSLDDEVVDVLRLYLIELSEREIIDDQKVDPNELAKLLVVGLIEARRLEPLEHVIGAHLSTE